MIDYKKIDELVEKLDFDPKKVNFEKIPRKEKKEKPKYDYRKYHKRPMNDPSKWRTIGE